MVSRGFYRHYRGHVYMVFGVGCAKHEGERRFVVYTSVKTEEISKGFDFLLRDESDFEEFVDPATGFAWHGQSATPAVPRFARITDPEQSIVV